MTYQAAAHMKQALLGTFDLTGRSTRAEVLTYFIVASLVVVGTGAASLALWPDGAGQILVTAVRWIVLVPAIALFVRRVHDHGRSGWWVLLFIAAILVGEITPPLTIWIQVASLSLLVAIFALLAMPGTRGANHYGDDPRGSDRDPE